MGCKIQLCRNSHRLPPARRAYWLDGRHSGICAHSVLQFRYFALYRQMAERRQERTAQNGRHTEYGARAGLRFPTTMPVMAVDFWGDACAMVPWAEYMARGDKRLPEKMYPVMKKYVKACKFWAGFGFGKHRYIWHTPHLLHFGDWVAPDVNKMSEWQKRSKWTATASLCPHFAAYGAGGRNSRPRRRGEILQ